MLIDNIMKKQKNYSKEDVRLFLIDLKQTEFIRYKDYMIYDLEQAKSVLNDFVNKIVSHRNYNYIRNKNQAKVQFVKYCIFAIIVIFICYIIRSFI